MESVYWTLTYACHRACAHCQDTRFKPYAGADFDVVVDEGIKANRKIIANFPDTFEFLDPSRAGEDGVPVHRIGRIILTGGELLLDGVRDRLLYPVLDELQSKYWGLEARVAVETTGDILELDHITGMIERGVWLIRITGIDKYHDGVDDPARSTHIARIRELMAQANVREAAPRTPGNDYYDQEGPFFTIVGAEKTADYSYAIFPRGRALQNGLATNDYATNLCSRFSGAIGFLNFGFAGAEIAIEPNGNMYPCRMKTKVPLGNLVRERMVDIIESLRAHPSFDALNRGDPEHMGEAFGVDRKAFKALSHQADGIGREIASKCLGCDKVFEQHLAALVEDIQAKRIAASHAARESLIAARNAFADEMFGDAVS